MPSEPRPGKIRKFIDLDREDVDWLDNESGYPPGKYSHLLTLLLKQFRLAHVITPKDAAMKGAIELRKLVETGAVDLTLAQPDEEVRDEN